LSHKESYIWCPNSGRFPSTQSSESPTIASGPTTGPILDENNDLDDIREIIWSIRRSENTSSGEQTSREEQDSTPGEDNSWIQQKT
jgi:hypothetical protein